MDRTLKWRCTRRHRVHSIHLIHLIRPTHPSRVPFDTYQRYQREWSKETCWYLYQRQRLFKTFMSMIMIQRIARELPLSTTVQTTVQQQQSCLKTRNQLLNYLVTVIWSKFILWYNVEWINYDIIFIIIFHHFNTVFEIRT